MQGPRVRPVLLDPWDLALREDISVRLPREQCAFKQCVWHGASDAELYEHLLAAHPHPLLRCANMMPHWHSIKDRVWSVYSEAIAEIARRGAPLATGAIDRRSLKNYVDAFDGEGIQSLVCFSCARRFPHVSTWRKNDIDWTTVLSHVDRCASVDAVEPKPNTFCNCLLYTSPSPRDRG